MAVRLGPREYQDVSRLVAAATEMVLLDRYWTQEARASSERDVDVDGLDSVVAQLERLLLEVDLAARPLVAASRGRGADLEESYRWLVSTDGPFDERRRAKVEELVGDDSGDLTAFVGRAAAGHARQVDPERRALAGELDKLRRGRGSDGDMSPEEEQVLAEVAVAAALLAGPEAFVVVEAVGHLLDFLFG